MAAHFLYAPAALGMVWLMNPKAQMHYNPKLHSGQWDVPGGLRWKIAKLRSRETEIRRSPSCEKASCVTVKAWARSGSPRGAQVATSHTHTAANCAVCAYAS